jgi:Domain of unknown function (DUF4157)
VLERAPRDGRSLSDTERRLYADHFSRELLDSARVIDGRVPFWLRPDMCGVTLGPHIHFRSGAYDPRSEAGIELLGHELVHVRQYHDGMTLLRYLWASRRGYWRNPYEVEARAVAALIRAQWRGERFARDQATGKSSIECASDSATSMPSTPADMMPPA